MNKPILAIAAMLPLSTMADETRFDTITINGKYEEAEQDGYDSLIALGAGVEGTKGISDNAYLGGYLLSYITRWDFENSDNFVRGTVSGFGLFLGGETPATDVVSIIGRVEFSSAVADLELSLRGIPRILRQTPPPAWKSLPVCHLMPTSLNFRLPLKKV